MKCQNFGHTTSKCRRSVVVCAKCGGNHPISDCYSLLSICPNCKGDHPAFSQHCPKFHRAKVAASNRTSYSEALKKLNAPIQSGTYQPVHTAFPPLATSVTTSNTSTIPSSTAIVTANTTVSQSPVNTTASNPNTQPITIVKQCDCDCKKTANTNCSSNPPTLADICPSVDLQNFI